MPEKTPRNKKITSAEIADKTDAQAELLYNRLVKRCKHLKKWARRCGVNAFRLYDRDIPEIPLTLDLYDDAISGALYRRPYEKDELEEAKWLFAMKSAAARALNIPENRIFLKERRRLRRRQETGKQYGKISNQNFYREIKEGDLLFRVNLSDYLDTGLFLDARRKRAFILSASSGKRVLNLFSHTCSLSVAAAKGGAIQIDSVDLSNTYLNWGKINFALNGLQSDGAFSFIRMDAIQYIREAVKRKLRWDLVILDPPSFSNSKKMRGVLDIRKNYTSLILDCLSLLTPGGTLWFSSNAKGFRPIERDFPGFTVKNMEKELVDEDFRGKKIPLCFTFTG